MYNFEREYQNKSNIKDKRRNWIDGEEKTYTIQKEENNVISTKVAKDVHGEGGYPVSSFPMYLQIQVAE